MSTRINFQTTESQPLILLPTYLDGKGPFDFVLDTGASMSIMTEELANLVGVEGKEAKEALGAAGKKMSTALGNVGSMSIGETSVENLQIGIMKELPKCVGHGAIGYNFLREFVLTIDYRSNVLTLDSLPNQVSERYQSRSNIPFRLASPDKPIILVDVLVNCRERYPFVLDTGASHTLVSPELGQRMSINGLQAGPIIGAGGAVQSSVGTFRSLTLGEASLEQVTVIIADIFSPLRQAAEAPFEGILGHTFLSHFKLKINYPNEFLRLEP